MPPSAWCATVLSCLAGRDLASSFRFVLAPCEPYGSNHAAATRGHAYRTLWLCVPCLPFKKVSGSFVDVLLGDEVFDEASSRSAAGVCTPAAVLPVLAPTLVLPQLCLQVRSLKRARDIRDQLVGLMERVEIDMVSDSSNLDGERVWPALVLRPM
eukprot:1161646-Pelagomonas_calceolata.AAC.3